MSRAINGDLGRDFNQTSVHLDWTNARDAVLATNINVYSASLRQTFGDHLSGLVTAGVSDSHYGAVTFGGISVTATF